MASTTYKLSAMKSSSNYQQILLHLAWWFFYIGNFLIAIYVRSPGTKLYFFDMVLHFLSGILFFYFYIRITAKWLFEKRRILIGIVLFLINATLLYSVQYSRVILAYYTDMMDQVPTFYLQVHTLIWGYFRDVVQFTGFGTVYWYYHNSLRQQQEKLDLERYNHRIEISFLKSQINEHFTYNMLSMFHSEAIQYSDQLASGILALSDLMRYSVAENKNMLVTLDEEIKYVYSYLELNRQRFGERVQVLFHTEGDTKPWEIPHLCMMTLVENAFKHGALKKAPLELILFVTSQELNFSTKNRKKNSASELSTGIGLKNLQRRLLLICGENAKLNFDQDENYFYAHLKISKRT